MEDIAATPPEHRTNLESNEKGALRSLLKIVGPLQITKKN